MNKVQEKNNLEIEKIIVNSEDELIDILKAVEETRAEKIILTFTEPSDILVSPINLKVILETADEQEKPLISLIVQNPAGIRNAKESGMTVTETSGSILDSFWEEAEEGMKERLEDKNERLKNIKRGVKQEVIIPEEKVGDGDSKSEFQKRVEEALEKSKSDLNQKKRIVQDSGVTVAIDGELEESGREPSIVGKSIKPIITKPKSGKNFSMPSINMPRLPKISLPALKGKLLLTIILPLILIVVLTLWLLYTMLPLVKVKIYVQSKAVSVAKTFSGDINTQSFDADKGVLPVKREEIKKDSSNTIKATGTAYKGTKAQGIITFQNWTYPSTSQAITLKAGTKVTSSGGFIFETNSDASIGFASANIPVTATAVGEEYNVAQGDYFTVSGYKATELSGQNVDSAMSGGTKSPYVVLSQNDVNKAVESMKKELFSVSEEELSSKAIDGWDMIDSTLKKDLDGEVQSDIPIGAEADNVTVTIKTKVSALFYQKGNIESSINQILTNQAVTQGLFEETTGQLVLSEDVESEIKIVEVKKESAKVSLTASSWVRPNIDRNALINELKGKSWAEGVAILESKSLSNQPPQAEFQPESFPQWLRYFPTRQGRMFVNIEEIE